MLRSVKSALYLHEPDIISPSSWSINELTVEDFRNRAEREKQYRFLGYVECKKSVDIRGEWAQFCALVGLRLLPENNLKNPPPIGKTFSQWLEAAGVRKFTPRNEAQAARLPHIYLDYID